MTEQRRTENRGVFVHKYYPHLFSPLRIGDKVAKNRIACAPQSVIGGTEGDRLTQRGFSYYLEKARGGCGIVTLGERQVLSPFFQHPDPEEITKYRLLTDMIRDRDALSSIELGHRGCEDYVFEPGAHVEGPSGGVKETGVIIDEMTEERMEELSQAYAKACETILDCGFDMVMIHGGHSWLLAQFLSPLFNHRKDKYGGSLENRARFPLMVLDRIRQRVGRRLLIEYRLSAEEVLPEGLHIDEAVEFSRMLESRVDIIHASVGTHIDPECYTFTSIYHQNGINLPLAAAIKEAVSIPVAAIGGINTPELGEMALATGQADIIYMGRQMLADPHFANKAEDGQMEEINTCIRCMCCHDAPVPPTYLSCTVNPTGGREFLPPPARRSGRRKIVVIGGGPAGMAAACRSADLGHEVVLFEKSGSLGGTLEFAAYDRYKGDLRQFRDNLIARTLRRDIDLRLNTEVGAKELSKLEADLVVCAVGAEAAVPPIPGIESAVYVMDAYRMAPQKMGERIVILGGGPAGCEFGLHLAAEGKKITLIEMGTELARGSYRMHREWLLQRLEKEVNCLTGMRCVEITLEGVVVQDKEGTKNLYPADKVVYALGSRAKAELVERLRQSVSCRFAEVGDCHRAGKLKDAIHQGYAAVDSL